MNETERHIGTLNQMQSHYSHIRHNDDEFMALEASKEVLREKAEREKGCEYCNTTLYIRAERTLLPVMAPLTYADALEHELINITGKDYVPTEKRYCHMCGRKLKEDGK